MNVASDPLSYPYSHPKFRCQLSLHICGPQFINFDFHLVAYLLDVNGSFLAFYAQLYLAHSLSEYFSPFQSAHAIPCYPVDSLLVA